MVRKRERERSYDGQKREGVLIWESWRSKMVTASSVISLSPCEQEEQE